MDKLITEKLYDLLDELDNSSLIKKLEQTKQIMLQDEETKKKIEQFNKIKNEDDKEIFLAKKSLYNNEYVKNYLQYENQLNYLIMNLNKKLNSIIDKKGCR